jgi:hypothetical protein
MFQNFKKIFIQKEKIQTPIEVMEAKKRALETQLELLIEIEKKLKNEQQKQS